MASYTILNSAGDTVVTVKSASTTSDEYPVEFIGQGYSPYHEIIGNTQYHLLENFASSSSPTNPVTGMTWYDSGNKIMKFYNGSSFQSLSSSANNGSAVFDMDTAATGVDLTATGDTVIFTNDSESTMYPTALILAVSGTPTADADDTALVNLFVSSSEDVMESNVFMVGDENYFVMFPVQGTTHACATGSTITLEVTEAISSGTMLVDAYLFGFGL